MFVSRSEFILEQAGWCRAKLILCSVISLAALPCYDGKPSASVSVEFLDFHRYQPNKTLLESYGASGIV